MRKPRSSDEQQREACRIPVRGRELREFGCQVGARMQVGIGEVAPDEPQAGKAIQKRRRADGSPRRERATEVPVLDQRELGLRGAEGRGLTLGPGPGRATFGEDNSGIGPQHRKGVNLGVTRGPFRRPGAREAAAGRRGGRLRASSAGGPRIDAIRGERGDDAGAISPPMTASDARSLISTRSAPRISSRRSRG